MTNTITFKWNTGKIEIAACAVLNMNVTQLKNLVKTATANIEEVKEQVRDYLQSEITKLNPKSEYDKKQIEQYNKLLSAVEDRKQTKTEKLMAKVIKSCAYERYAGVFEDAGKYCVLDGFRIFRFANPLNGLPVAKETYDTAKAIGSTSAYTVKLELPAVRDLKADIKIAKLSGADVNRVHIKTKGRRIGFLYDFGYGLPLVDALALIDMMEALPECEAATLPNGANSPIYFSAGDDDGFLLPVKKHCEFEPEPLVEEEPDDFSDIDVEAVRAALEDAKENGSAFVNRVMADTAAIAEAERIEEEERAAAIARVQAVYNTVYYGYTGERDTCAEARIAGFKLDSGFFTEERVKDLLLFPVSVSNEVLLALPAHVEEPREAAKAQIVRVFSSARFAAVRRISRRCPRLCRIRAGRGIAILFSPEDAFCEIAAIDSS